jgi:hypothetical protein
MFVRFLPVVSRFWSASRISVRSRSLRRLPRPILPFLAATVLAATAAPAAADGIQGYPISTPFATPVIVPGGVAVFDVQLSAFRLVRYDGATGSQSELASFPLDPRTDPNQAEASGNASASATHLGVTEASTFIAQDGTTIEQVGGQVVGGPLGGSLAVLHRCKAEYVAAPLDLDGSLLVSADRSTCGPRDFGEAARFDVVVHDLLSGTARTISTNQVVGDDDLAIRAPFVAWASAPDATGEGLGRIPSDVHVVDLRTGAEVTHLQFTEDIGVRSLDVGADGRLTMCGASKIGWAAAGETALHPTSLPCRRVQALPDGRVLASHDRQIDLDDVMSGASTPLVVAPRLDGFDSDGTRIGWTDTTCTDELVHVADISAMPLPAAAKLSCPVLIGPSVKVRGKAARVKVTCPNGCVLLLELFVPHADKPVANRGVDLPPNGSKTVVLKLTRRGAAKLARVKNVGVEVNINGGSMQEFKRPRV